MPLNGYIIPIHDALKLNVNFIGEQFFIILIFSWQIYKLENQECICLKKETRQVLAKFHLANISKAN